MPNETRDFTRELIFALNRNLTHLGVKTISDKVYTTLISEDKGIESVTAYFFHAPASLGFRLYFVISNPAYPPDTHMLLPLQNNERFTAVFLDENDQIGQDELNKASFSVTYR